MIIFKECAVMSKIKNMKVGARILVTCSVILVLALVNVGPVSYTHLDVYKRQMDKIARSTASC